MERNLKDPGGLKTTPAALLSIHHLFVLFLKTGMTSTNRKVALLPKKRGKTHKGCCRFQGSEKSWRVRKVEERNAWQPELWKSGAPAPQALLLQLISKR